MTLAGQWRRLRVIGAGLAASLSLCSPVQADDVSTPLSAIDWLTHPAEQPIPASSAHPRPVQGFVEPPIVDAVVTPEVTVRSLDTLAARAPGLFQPSRRGLPQQLWEGSDAEEAVALLRATPLRPTPALAQMVADIVLARARPPRAGGGDALVAARADRLLETGDAADALRLLQSASQISPDLFRRRFDAALLTGAEDYACATMDADPSLAPDWPSRIFCLARSGDWPAAALTLGTARALGDITAQEESLLARFLDPDLFESGQLLPRTPPRTPLEFRMLEAIGAPVQTSTLPLSFAPADLRPNIGWKSRIEAGERLARAGSLPPEELVALYREGRPSASGGVWQRVAAIQALDTALRRSDTDAVSRALPDAWAAMVEAQTEPAFAALWGARLARMEVAEPAREAARHLILLSPAASTYTPRGTPGLAEAIALGITPLPAPTNPQEAALADGLSGAPAVPEILLLLEADRVGEALLTCVVMFEEGRQGAPEGLRDALATLRSLGQEQTARRAALQVLLLDRRP